VLWTISKACALNQVPAKSLGIFAALPCEPSRRDWQRVVDTFVCAIRSSRDTWQEYAPVSACPVFRQDTQQSIVFHFSFVVSRL
jgi:hypothetical protein